ncbi:MAG TPA: hypothetical protein H9839_03320 [Candidatus Intestinimonas stercorigallinarum]|nr:hypothetical protein [Candidatus Intestinimonas stercorigallinarum]
MSNPTWEKVREGAALARACQADLVLAAGGRQHQPHRHRPPAAHPR